MQGPFAFHPPRWAWRLFAALTALGALVLVVGAFVDAQRTWANVLLLSVYLVGLSTGSLVLIALHDVTGARWFVPLRRLPEALAVALPVAGVGLLLVLLFRPSLYAWTAHSATGEEHVSPLRALWLTRSFFVLRGLVYLAAWAVFTWLIVRASRLRDQAGSAAATSGVTRLSAGFLVVFGVTCWLSSYDWLMSLEPGWSSTIFAVYHFAGLFQSSLAAVILLAVLLRRSTPLRAFVTEDRLHDLGKLLFGFSCFWMYTWFCQYLLIWYTNHPEETAYFLRRSVGPWPAVLVVDLVLNWGIVFLVLLFRVTKRSPGILAAVALCVLAGRWVDLYQIIFPSLGETSGASGLLEVGLGLGAVGLFALAVLGALTLAPLVPMHASAEEAGADHRSG
jgi:hypothetical protein